MPNVQSKGAKLLGMAQDKASYHRYYIPVRSNTQVRRKNVTICIATICADSKNAIVAGDRMVTSGDFTVAFEHETRKIVPLAENCVALTAGSALVGTDLFRAVRSNIHVGAAPPISEMVNRVKDEYLQIRNRRIEERYFKVRGFDVKWFHENERMLNPDTVFRLDHVLEEYKFNLEILIAGVDGAGAHIYYIYPPCCSECFDSLGHCSIGSGERHAESTFIAYRYAPSYSLENALYMTYEAKRKAEIAVGVGHSTDMAIVSEKGIQFISEDILKKLKEMYEDKINAENLKKEEIDKILKASNLFGSGGT
jgi:hypothetical protein